MPTLDDGELVISSSWAEPDATVPGQQRFESLQSSNGHGSERHGFPTSSLTAQNTRSYEARVPDRDDERLAGERGSPDGVNGTHSSLEGTVADIAPAAQPVPASPIVITDELLLNYQRCQRRAFLDQYAQSSQRDATSDYLRKLQQDSLVHQVNILSTYHTQRPRYPSRDWKAGFVATHELMQQGCSHIERGVLYVQYEEDVVLVSRPKILIRQPGVSKFGDWLYVPADIKLGKRPKADYQVIAAFHAFLLSLIQDEWPESSRLILRHGNEYRVNLPDQVPKMETVLANCIDMVRQQQEPMVFISRNRCDLCHWFSHCYDVAQTESHLSLLPGVTPSRYTHLKSLNLTTVEALAQATSPSLASLPGFGRHIAHKLVRQAQSTHQERALKLIPLPDEDSHPPLQEWIPTAPVELYFDIEAAPERELIYLHGVVVVDRVAQTETFYGLMAESPEDEVAIWEQFIDLTARYPTAPIFHFCPYEAQTVKRLGATYNTPDIIIEDLIERFVDLHDRVIRSTTLPIESYALKAIARWVGFDWRDQRANGAQSIFWYDQWLDTGDRTYLEDILQYNEDDCRATWKVKDWLVNFLEEWDE